MLTHPVVSSLFVEFFRERGHHLVQDTSLLPPDGDPVLFVTSGMHPLTPFLLGRPHPGGTRLVNVQRCLRTTDLDEVGDDTHLTVFQMLGSWSLGDYSGPESLRWGLEFLTKHLGVDPSLLYSTVFEGDDLVPLDSSSLETWRSLGVPVECLGVDNWWSNGPVGPCGPDSEIFFWTGEEGPIGSPSTDERWVEVWNHVMMRHLRHEDGTVSDLQRRNVDTGMGLERLLMVLQGVGSVYDTDVFEPWMRLLPSLWGLSGTDLRVVSDHLRSSLVVVSDGVLPSNTSRGYVLRRLVRRLLGVIWSVCPEGSLRDLPVSLLEHTGVVFGTSVTPETLHVLVQEEERFRLLLSRSTRLVKKHVRGGVLTPEVVEFLRDTHGVPPDVTRRLVLELSLG